jgi:hypothetical protein
MRDLVLRSRVKRSVSKHGPARRFGASRSVLRGRFAAPQDEGVKLTKFHKSALKSLKTLARATFCAASERRVLSFPRKRESSLCTAQLDARLRGHDRGPSVGRGR